jgi:hypothetical protein
MPRRFFYEPSFLLSTSEGSFACAQLNMLLELFREPNHCAQSAKVGFTELNCAAMAVDDVTDY